MHGPAGNSSSPGKGGMQHGEHPEVELELLAANEAIPGTPCWRWALLFLPKSSHCAPCCFPCVALIPCPQPGGTFASTARLFCVCSAVVLPTSACQQSFAGWVCGLLILALLLFSCGSLGISSALCKGDLIWGKMPVKASYFPASSVLPTLLLQHRHAKSRAGVGEREWGCRGYFNIVYETTAEGYNLIDALLASKPLRASRAERGSCHHPFTSIADPALSQPGEVNQKLAL